MKKILMVLLIFVLLLSTLTFNASSEGDFKMKEFDKAYITFVFDDGIMPFTEHCYNLFETFDMPVCFAVIANKVDDNPELISVLKKVEKSGGEVLSHTFTHAAFNEYSVEETFEYQLGTSFVHLRGLGFNVNGVIEAGNGGGEAKANYELMEKVTRKYYKYSNAYGVSPQYKKKRTWLSYASDKYAFAKATIDDAIAKKEWVVFSAHSFNEVPYEDLDKILTYLKEKGTDQVEVVNWNYIYTNFGEYTGPLVPTKAALDAVEKYKQSQNSSSSSSQSGGSSSSSKASSSESKNNSQTVNNSNSTTSINNSTSVNITNSTTSNVTNSTTNSTTDNSTTTVVQSSDDSASAYTASQAAGTNEKKSSNTVWWAVGIIAATLLICAGVLLFALKYKSK